MKSIPSPIHRPEERATLSLPGNNKYNKRSPEGKVSEPEGEKEIAFAQSRVSKAA